MPHRFCRTLAALLFIVLVPCVRAQSGAPMRLALSCQNVYPCNEEFYRTEMTFAEFVRDVNDADVQVLITSQTNGSGGETFTVRFLGQGTLAGRNDELLVPTAADATDDDKRRAVLRVLRAGLVSYAARLGRLEHFTVSYAAPATSQAATTPQRDPWDHWVMALSARSNFNGDKNYSYQSGNVSASANRVTEQWKTSFSVRASSNTNTYTLTDGVEDRVTQRNYGANALGVYSLGGQLSAGLEANAFTSTYGNTDLSVRVAPGLEYDVFPYAENTKRSVTLRYDIGVGYVNYKDTTIYRKLQENLLDHRLSLGVSFQQPWGTLSLNSSATQYLNHLRQYSISNFAQADVRIVKGLSFDFYVGADFLRNQRNISGEGVDDDDIYTRRRALETGYSYFGGAGLRYTFGSKFTGVVNPRFNGGGGIFIIN